MRTWALQVALLAVQVALVAAAAEEEPHYHSGKLTPYELGPPSVLLSDDDEQRLARGSPVMQMLFADDSNTRRLVMVQDISAPANVVFGRIIDTDSYSQMVDGVDFCANYVNTATTDGLQETRSTYEISCMHMRFKYFMKHTFDPVQRCMSFHLDYDRKSDLDDSVGYWFVADRGRQSSRVYYSCECKLRGWVPAPILKVMTKEAMKKGTSWVEREAMKEWRAMQRQGPADRLVQFMDNARASLEQLQPFKPPQLLQPPRAVGDWLQGRRSAVQRGVQLVSATRPRKQPSAL